MFVTHFSLLLFGLVLKGLKTFDVDILYHNGTNLGPAQLNAALDHRRCIHIIYHNKSSVPL